jgi:predicted nucleotide-binding protein
VPVPTLQVSVSIGHELLGQCIKQGQALVQRASLVGDFSDYESWKSARKQWIDPTVQALEHMYGGPREAREFLDAATCPENSKRWQEQYGADLKCVEEAIDLLTVLQGELAFTGVQAPSAAELPAGDPQPNGVPEQPAHEHAAPHVEAMGGAPEVAEPKSGAQESTEREHAEREPTGREPTERPTPVPAPGLPDTRDEPRGAAFAETSGDDAEEDSQEVGAELTPAQHVSSQLAHHANGATPAERDPAGAAPARTRQVLLAHGRDERWRQAVEHLLEQAGEHEIRIINQRSGEHGRLADALDDEHAPASRYAVVLLTADDVGGPRLESDTEPFFSTRAQQEVVFQMGFLVAALSPGRVCVLYEDGVELPYDLEGVSHVRLDLAGTWQPKLLLHLRRAGFDYDMNKLVQV